MQVTESENSGLKRTLKVVVDAAELGEKFSSRLGELKGRVQLKGFRKGKVPEAHLKKVYGRSVMSEVLQETIRESSSKAIKDRKERPAAMPDIAMTEDQDEIEQVLAGKADLTYSMTFEVMPDIKVTDLAKLKVEKCIADVTEDHINDALEKIAARNIKYEVVDDRAAEKEDQVTIDYRGLLNGEPFEGGTGEDLALVVGNASFIPGFEEGLIGIKAGDDRTIEATFPEDYQAQHLAGKDVVFEVKAKSVGKPAPPTLDDDFAKGLGIEEGIDKLKEMVREQVAQEHQSVSYMQVKKDLLDTLESAHEFELPPSLVKREFDGIWKEVNDRLKQSGKTFEDEGKTEDAQREEYSKIAERRIRLGLVVAEIGDANKIDVTQDELRQALMEEARRYPGQEKHVYEYYEKTPGALDQLRAPLFEDKVIAHILTVANVSEKRVSREELMKDVREAG
ncbi:MAG: trigger factor [Alphaproteobacteria bacterium]|nr:trigger factor [Alphaproteobacteria bacterium]